VYSRFVSCYGSKNSGHHLTTNLEIVDKVTKEIISRFFVSEDKDKEEIMKNVHKHFSTKLKRDYR